MLLRQLPAASSRSAAVMWNWTSFSASSKVEAETAGPTSGAVPNAGGAPGCAVAAGCGVLLQAARAAAVAPARNCLRDFRFMVACGLYPANARRFVTCHLCE